MRLVVSWLDPLSRDVIPERIWRVWLLVVLSRKMVDDILSVLADPVWTTNALVPCKWDDTLTQWDHFTHVPSPWLGWTGTRPFLHPLVSVLGRYVGNQLLFQLALCGSQTEHPS